MKAKELREFLSNIPDEAEVFLECEYGDNIERSSTAVVSRSEIEGNDYNTLMFEYNNWRNCYDKDCVEEYPVNGKITAVLIQS